MDPARRCLFVVLEGLDWATFDRARKAGHLPDFSVGDGTQCQPLHFPLAAARVATLVSAMTGAWPDLHGIVTAEAPDGKGGFRSVRAADRQRPAVWERLDQEGLPTVVVGWPATVTAATRHSNQVEAGFGFASSPDPVTDLSRWVFPPELGEALKDCWLSPNDLDPAVLTALAPAWQRLNQDVDRRLASLALVLAENASRHAAFLELIGQRPWALATLCLSLPAELASLQQLSESLADDLFGELTERAWPLIAEFLRTIRQVVPAGINLVLAGLPHPERSEAPGFVSVDGPAFAAGLPRQAVSLLDLATLVSRACGLDPGRELTERSAGEEWSTPDFEALRVIERPLLKQQGEEPTAAEFRHFNALGVVAASRSARGDDAGALPFWEAVCRLAPNHLERRLQLAECQRRLGLLAEALDTAYSAIHPTWRHDPRPLLTASALELESRRPDRARQLLEQAGPKIGASPEFRRRAAILRLRLGDWEEAAAALETLLAERPDDTVTRFFLARCEIGRHRWHNALEHALRCSQMGHANPRTLEIMAHAWHGLGMLDQARQALDTACDLAPDWPRPRAKRVLLARRMHESAERIEGLVQEYHAVRARAAERRREAQALARGAKAEL